MFERLESPEDVFAWNLGAALKMERTIVDMLDGLIEEANDGSVKQALASHQQETRGHVQNLEQAFQAMGWDVDHSPCPTIEAIEKEGKANIKKADDRLADALILAGATETEHHEMAVYETLIIQAEGMGRQEVVQLLNRNLEEEKHALSIVSRLAREQAGDRSQHQQAA